MAFVLAPCPWAPLPSAVIPTTDLGGGGALDTSALQPSALHPASCELMGGPSILRMNTRGTRPTPTHRHRVLCAVPLCTLHSNALLSLKALILS
jgi:hypothetical protein